MADKERKQIGGRPHKGRDVRERSEDLTDQGCLYCGRDKGLRLHVVKFQPIDCKAAALLIYYDCQYCRAKETREAVKAGKEAARAGL